MLQCGDDPDSPVEPLLAGVCCEVLAQHLDGDLPAVAEVVSQVDCRHAAGADLAFDAIPSGQRGREGIGTATHDVVGKVAWADKHSPGSVAGASAAGDRWLLT